MTRWQRDLSNIPGVVSVTRTLKRRYRTLTDRQDACLESIRLKVLDTTNGSRA
jgi:hypothetical protein